MALIITIIVMLILVVVTVQILIDSDLIGVAQSAGDRTKEEYERERTQSEVEINGKKYNSVEDYLAKRGKIESVHSWSYVDEATRATVQCKCEECLKADSTNGIRYNIGQQVKRTESDILLANASAATGAEWVVFGIEDADKNGSNETLLITTLAPSTETLTLGQESYGANDDADRIAAADAYNNGPTYIENKVKEIYGEEARAMTIEDVNRTLGYEPTGGMLVNGETEGVIFENGFETKLKDVMVDEDTKLMDRIITYNTTYREGKYYTPAHPTGREDGGAELGEYKLDGYAYAMQAIPSMPTAPYVATDICNEAKNLVFKGGEYFYWLASRGVCAFFNSGNAYACFGPGAVRYGEAGSCIVLLDSNGLTIVREAPVRALVSLRSNVLPEGGEQLVSRESITMGGDM